MAKKSAATGGAPRSSAPQTQSQLSTSASSARQPSPSRKTSQPSTVSPVAPSSPSKPVPAASFSVPNGPQAILWNLWNEYLKKTPQRVKLIDAFLGFLVAVGVIQFVYCVVAGNYPFNAFLAGFGATVGEFVLTASLRIQINPENKAEFESISHERAFADYVFGSLLLQFFCVNFIN